MRKIASCTLFDVAADPLESRPIADRPGRVQELRRLGAAIERENGRLEVHGLPEALRRGLQGDREAAEDVAALFDDARVDLRREAARCAFKLRAPVMKLQLERALATDEDLEVRRWSALALVRLGAGEGAATVAEGLLRDPSARLRTAAALALAEQGDGRGESELLARWESAFVPGAREPGDLEEARELLAALVKIRARSAAPVLVRSLEDVRLRSHVAEALGELGDARGQAPLLATFAGERYADARPKEARALLRLGAREGMLGPLRRFAGVPEPMLEAVDIAREAGLLTAAQGGWSSPAPSSRVEVQVAAAGTGPARLLVLAGGEGELSGRVDGVEMPLRRSGSVWTVELPAVGSRARIELEGASGVSALWLVRRAQEIPPPPPRQWAADAGAAQAEGGL